MKYGLIGEKLGHSYSCQVHRALGNPDYVLKEIAPDALGDAQKQALRAAFRMASEPRTPAEPLDWMETTCPARWKTQEGEAEYDWFEDFGAEPLKR